MKKPHMDYKADIWNAGNFSVKQSLLWDKPLMFVV